MPVTFFGKVIINTDHIVEVLPQSFLSGERLAIVLSTGKTVIMEAGTSEHDAFKRYLGEVDHY
jgi:hypothetical protein